MNRRQRLIALGASLATLGTLVPAAASSPKSFFGVEYRFAESAEIEFGCELKESNAAGEVAFMTSHWFDVPGEGDGGGRAVGFGTGHVRVSAGFDDHRLGFDHRIGDAQAVPGEIYWVKGRIPADTQLHAVWIGWNARVACELMVDGVAISATRQSMRNAAYIMPSEFESGIHATSPIGQATVRSFVEKANAGFVFAIMPGYVLSSMEATGPSGRSWAAGSGQDLWIHDDAIGLWRFTAERSVLPREYPLLFFASLGTP